MSAAQLELLPKHGEPAPVSHALIVAQPSKLAAIRLAQTVSGLEDKQVYGPLGIEKAQWSRIKSGDAHFPTNSELPYFELVGNDIPLIWLAHQRGYELRPLRSDLERQVAELTEKLAQAERDKQVIVEFMRQARAGA